MSINEMKRLNDSIAEALSLASDAEHNYRDTVRCKDSLGPDADGEIFSAYQEFVAALGEVTKRAGWLVRTTEAAAINEPNPSRRKLSYFEAGL